MPNWLSWAGAAHTRLPLPSIHNYAILSSAVFLGAVLNCGTPPDGQRDDGAWDEQFWATYISHLLQNTFVVWSMINLTYCFLLMLGKLIQKLIFGQLRVIEQQNMRDSFWNYVFYKFIFIFGVLNVQGLEELILWSLWFSTFSFLRLLNQLSKDRFEYIAYSPNTARKVHVKIVLLLFSIFSWNLVLTFIACFVFNFTNDYNILGFMMAECMLLFLRNLIILVKYGFHLRDLQFVGTWENKSVYTYYSELVLEMITLSVDLLHHTHMLVWSNVFLSMACLVICMQIRHIVQEMQHKVLRHKEFCHVTTNMDNKFPEVTNEELDSPCAICWDSISVGRRLPCSHIFHRSCLRSWLVHDSTCPTCRHSLNFSARPGAATATAANAAAAAQDGAGQNPAAAPGNHPAAATRRNFFHFDGSRIASWLPSFSVEVTHTAAAVEQQPVSNSQRDYWVHQVHLLFPQIPIQAIEESIGTTNSLEMTIDAILEGTLHIPLGARVPGEEFQDQEQFGNIVDQTQPVDTIQAPGVASESQSREPHTQIPQSSSSTSPSVQPGTSGRSSFVNQAQGSSITRSSSAGKSTLPDAFFGERFSKSPEERHQILRERKTAMINECRMKYLESHPEYQLGDPGIANN